MTDPSLLSPSPPEANGAGRRRLPWLRLLRFLLVPLVPLVFLVLALYEPVTAWLGGEDSHDQAAMTEWLLETRNGRGESLPDMVREYLATLKQLDQVLAAGGSPPTQDLFNRREAATARVALRREEIEIFLNSLCTPPTKVYPGQLPLFPVIYKLQIDLLESHSGPIVWDSGLPFPQDLDEPRRFRSTRYRHLRQPLQAGAEAHLIYQLHAYNKQQQEEQLARSRWRYLLLLSVLATVVGAGWMVLVQRRESLQERQRRLAQWQREHAERLLLQQERRNEEIERKLLEQRLAAQDAEQRALELKSQLFASIGIMAGSYAHNIKNLLVRPNDLLQRCLQGEGLSAEQSLMLHEVRQTLGTVTERLQQILRTVRRDPSHSEPRLLDLNVLVRELDHTWKELALDKWKLELELELDTSQPEQAGCAAGSLPIEGDESHLQQAAENLLFNARDAIFEMRNHLRDSARKNENLDEASRRKAVMAAAAWRGKVRLRTRRQSDGVVLEVSDNGVGMTEEVRRRCIETHFSTKRDNALYSGISTGMGLGLSFVVAILEHHKAQLEIDSEPLRGTTFRVRFPSPP